MVQEAIIDILHRRAWLTFDNFHERNRNPDICRKFCCSVACFSQNQVFCRKKGRNASIFSTHYVL